MYMLAGPNGAGKSTLYEKVIAPGVRAPFINADLIQSNELKDASMQASYRAAEIAESRRRQALTDKTDFVSESTFSHPSKLALIDDAKAAGFRVVVYHVNLRHPNLSVNRVAARFKQGGHDVPEDKIRERFERNKPLIRQAMLLADNAFVYDNSRFGVAPARCITFKDGKVIEVSGDVPAWARELYEKQLQSFSLSKLNPAAASFAEAKAVAESLGGAGTELQIADIKGGEGHLGPLVGETSMHLVQQVGNARFVAHFKAKLQQGLPLHRPVLVQYKQGQGLAQAVDPAKVLQSPQARSLSPERLDELRRLLLGPSMGSTKQEKSRTLLPGIKRSGTGVSR